MKEGLRVDSPITWRGAALHPAQEGLARKVKQGACAWVEHLLAAQRPVVTCVLVYGLVKQHTECTKGVDTSLTANHQTWKFC